MHRIATGSPSCSGAECENFPRGIKTWISRRLHPGYACWTGEMHIGGGRSRLPRSFYAATLPAAFRWNAALNALYRRLTERGKPHTVALVACARKLLVFANTVVARGTPWTERPAEA